MEVLLPRDAYVRQTSLRSNFNIAEDEGNRMRLNFGLEGEPVPSRFCGPPHLLRKMGAGDYAVGGLVDIDGWLESGMRFHCRILTSTSSWLRSTCVVDNLVMRTADQLERRYTGTDRF